MLTEEFQRRLEFCQRDEKESNCIGAALYLAGIINEERRIKPDDAYSLIDQKHPKVREEISEGSLLSWERTTQEGKRIIMHMGIAGKKEDGRRTIIHRTGTNRILERSDFLDTNEDYGYCDLVCYEPI